MTERVYRHWVACALTTGIVLLLLTPVLMAQWSLAQVLIFVQLPMYMLHQVEEHAGDRFRRFANEKMFGGYEVFSPAAILVVNIPGVWGVNLVSIYASAFGGAGWGLMGIDLTLVNAVAHVAGIASARGYNPGLWTALGMFFPVGGLALWTVMAAPGVTAAHHAVGLGVAIGLHAGILVYAKARMARLRRAG